ncbi:hypothetical protein FNV43_RR26007 [Rhamnella rubrinervis]|uniref:Uncharacterized protein n=1 Tax=Rhamnella rubrinervis TaxID=2594499 RepID=A0A8K0GJ85_9ROSA|nr:hypothetical protein FNV43_RR26007 [Rhamnella rubrinervis]
MEAENQYKKGLWTEEEDKVLQEYIKVHGRGQWNRIPKATGLKRCGKSCRLRWLNYLSPNVKRDGFSEEEDDLIIRLHNLIGNRWSLIAGRIPGRTDNQVKNHWNTHLCKKLGIIKRQEPARKLGDDNTSKIPHHEDQQQQGAGAILSTNNSNSDLNFLMNNATNSSAEAMEAVLENKTKEPALISDAVDHHHHHQASNEGTVDFVDESLLFSNDDYMLINSPCIVDFLDAFPVDLMCPRL